MKSTSKKVYEALTGHVGTRSKYRWVIVWVEGLSYRTGEKIKSIDRRNGITYTCNLTEALRVKENYLDNFRLILKYHGMTASFVPVTYAPKGTVFKPINY